MTGAIDMIEWDRDFKVLCDGLLRFELGKLVQSHHRGSRREGLRTRRAACCGARLTTTSPSRRRSVHAWGRTTHGGGDPPGARKRGVRRRAPAPRGPFRGDLRPEAGDAGRLLASRGPGKVGLVSPTRISERLHADGTVGSTARSRLTGDVISGELYHRATVELGWDDKWPLLMSPGRSPSSAV
jgi:hypothetical protein